MSLMCASSDTLWPVQYRGHVTHTHTRTHTHTHTHTDENFQSNPDQSKYGSRSAPVIDYDSTLHRSSISLPNERDRGRERLLSSRSQLSQKAVTPWLPSQLATQYHVPTSICLMYNAEKYINAGRPVGIAASLDFCSAAAGK